MVSCSYPSGITFWVTVLDISFHYWAYETIRVVGKALRVVEEIDEESGSVKVTIIGFNPLKFRIVIPFDNGEEVKVSLEYEKLVNY